MGTAQAVIACVDGCRAKSSGGRLESFAKATATRLGIRYKRSYPAVVPRG